MSFAGALGQGLLSAVAGGAGAYVDETKRQVARDDAAAEREKLLRLQDEIAAARQRAVEEEKRKRAVTDREELSGRIKGYAGKAKGMLPEMISGESDDQYNSVASVDRAADSAGNTDDLARREAIMAGDEPAYGLLSKLSDSEEQDLKRQEVQAKIDKLKFDASGEGKRPGYVPADSMYWDEEQGKWVKNPKSATHVYQHGDGSSGGGSGGGGSKKDPRIPAKGIPLGGNGFMLEKDIPIPAIANNGKAGGKRTKRSYFDFDGNEYTRSQWEAKYGSVGGDNKQTLAKTSGNMPNARVVSMAEVIAAAGGDKAKAAKLAAAIRAKGGNVE